jgi:hypothetical protein
MRRLIAMMMVVGFVFTGDISAIPTAVKFRRLPVKEYVDKMKAGWIGQMAGVGWGGPTEFRYTGKIIPADKIPKWKPNMINQFGQEALILPTVATLFGTPTMQAEAFCEAALPRRIQAILNLISMQMTLTIRLRLTLPA